EYCTCHTHNPDPRSFFLSLALLYDCNLRISFLSLSLSFFLSFFFSFFLGPLCVCVCYFLLLAFFIFSSTHILFLSLSTCRLFLQNLTISLFKVSFLVLSSARMVQFVCRHIFFDN